VGPDQRIRAGRSAPFEVFEKVDNAVNSLRARAFVAQPPAHEAGVGVEGRRESANRSREVAVTCVPSCGSRLQAG